MVQFQEILGAACLPKLTPDRVLVLIPAYNEAAKIGTVISLVKAQGFPVLVSDDGSVDDTAAISERQGARVVRAEKNEGKGASVRKGLAEFLKSGLEAVVLMDSDGQHDPADLGVFVGALESGADLVLGTRMERPEGMPWLRRVTNRIMSAVLSLFAGQRIPDSQCGYRAMTHDAARQLTLRSDRFEVESEMILEAAKHSLRIVSVPIHCIYADETSRIRPWQDTTRFFSFIFRYLRSRKTF